MKKVISLFLIAVLISGCNRTADNVSHAPQSLNASAPVPQSQNASAPEPSNTLIPTPEPSKSVQPSDSADTGSSVIKIGLCVVALFLCFWYLSRLLSPKFVTIEDYTMSDEYLVVPFEEIKSQGYRVCYLIRECISFYSWYIFDRGLFRNFYRDIETGEEVKGIPIFTNCVEEDKVEKYGIDYSYLYRPEPVT
ncbi:hypothetical protein [Candidatus Endomicrobiellum agilis]|uniref:hypothetical protein n=1 Tax=Candidatus Endomicrobiellum agilis TaxID=3238957 RepID=UPI0035772BEC|nr:hypothetical protein [Endomicrobium sp.]